MLFHKRNGRAEISMHFQGNSTQNREKRKGKILSAVSFFEDFHSFHTPYYCYESILINKLKLPSF